VCVWMLCLCAFERGVPLCRADDRYVCADARALTHTYQPNNRARVLRDEMGLSPLQWVFEQPGGASMRDTVCCLLL
jgi:hypothetical protein